MHHSGWRGGECPARTISDCWANYHDDIEKYEACVEWVNERGAYYPG